MKRTLAVTASVLALAVSAHVAAQTPQPSFIDYAPIAAPSSARAAGPAEVALLFPQPSFVDYVILQPTSTSAPQFERFAGGAVAQGFPQPSFSN